MCIWVFGQKMLRILQRHLFWKQTYVPCRFSNLPGFCPTQNNALLGWGPSTLNRRVSKRYLILVFLVTLFDLHFYILPKDFKRLARHSCPVIYFSLHVAFYVHISTILDSARLDRTTPTWSTQLPRLHCDRCRAGLVDAHSTNPVRHLLAFRLQLHGPEADRTNHRQILRLFHLTPAVCRWSTHVVCTWIQLGRNYAHICHWHWPQYYTGS